MTKTTLPDGTIEYRNADGQLHRTDGPAITGPGGYQEWWLNGQRHRTDGPALIWSDGTQEWYLNDQRHRADGPAFTRPSGGQEWWLNGKIMTQAEHAAAIEARFQDRAEIERLRAELAQLKAERDYANEHFGHLTQSVDHLITTIATTEHPDVLADAIKAVNRALYEFRKRAKRAGISMTTSAALATQTGGEV